MIRNGNEHAFSVRAALLASFTALLLLVAGCGGDDAPTAAGSPAELAPANGVLYAEVQLDPGEERSKEIRETLRKVAKRDVLDLLVKEIDESMKEENVDLTYEGDIKPVLGKRAGLFLLSFTGDFDGAAIFDLDDAQAAEDLLEKNHDSKDKKATYKGVTYWANSEDDSAAGVVEGRMVAGSDKGFKAAVDTVKGAKLAQNASYKKAIDKLDEARLGHLYLDVKNIISTVKGQFGSADAAVQQALQQAERQLGSQGAGVAVGVNFDKTGLLIEAVADANVKDTGEASTLIEDFPADAWFAFAAKGVVDGLADGFTEGFKEGFEQESGGMSVQEFSRQFEQATGVKPDRKLFESIEEIGAFAGGTSLVTLKAGLVAKSSDPEKLLADLKKIAEGMGPTLGAQVSDLGEGGFLVRIPNAPIQIAAGRNDDRVALGLGEPGLKQILEPTDRLGDSDAFKKVKEQLGDDFKPLLFVMEQPLMALVQSFGQNLGPEFQMAKTYIEAFSHLALGTTGSGEDYRFKLGLGLD